MKKSPLIMIPMKIALSGLGGFKLTRAQSFQSHCAPIGWTVIASVGAIKTVLL